MMKSKFPVKRIVCLSLILVVSIGIFTIAASANTDPADQRDRQAIEAISKNRFGEAKQVEVSAALRQEERKLGFHASYEDASYHYDLSKDGIVLCVFPASAGEKPMVDAIENMSHAKETAQKLADQLSASLFAHATIMTGEVNYVDGMNVYSIDIEEVTDEGIFTNASIAMRLRADGVLEYYFHRLGAYVPQDKDRVKVSKEKAVELAYEAAQIRTEEWFADAPTELEPLEETQRVPSDAELLGETPSPGFVKEEAESWAREGEKHFDIDERSRHIVEARLQYNDIVGALIWFVEIKQEEYENAYRGFVVGIDVETGEVAFIDHTPL